MAGSTFKTLKKAHDAVTVAAGDDLLAATRELKQNGILNIAVCLDSSTPIQLAVTATSDETGLAVEELIGLNGGAALNAGEGYAFTWPVSKGETLALTNKVGGATSRIRSAKLVLEVPVG